jgi:hypothetical protein
MNAFLKIPIPPLTHSSSAESRSTGNSSSNALIAQGALESCGRLAQVWKNMVEVVDRKLNTMAMIARFGR